jgi:hypothetical protein
MLCYFPTASRVTILFKQLRHKTKVVIATGLTSYLSEQRS